MQFRNPQKLVVCGHQSTVTQAGWKVSVWLQFLAEVRMVTAIVLTLLGVQGLAAGTVGWRSYFTENPTEFHDIPLTWEEEDTRVPDWISGTYVKNGPAQV